MSESLWTLEERFWTAGPDFYTAHLASDPVMLFPGAGLMRGQAITDALAQAPRWLSVEMTDRVEFQPTADVALLAYRAHGRRADDRVVGQQSHPLPAPRGRRAATAQHHHPHVAR